MSFGYGVGDVVALAELSWTIYKSCKEAPSSFENLSQEVLSLHAVLKEAEDNLSGHVLSQAQQAGLEIVMNGCRSVLDDLQTLVKKYESLGSRSKRTWDRLRWSSNDIPELRSRLISSTTLFTAFLKSAYSSRGVGSHSANLCLA